MQSKPNLQHIKHKTNQQLSKNNLKNISFMLLNLPIKFELFEPNNQFTYKIITKTKETIIEEHQFTCIGNIGNTFQILANTSQSKIFIINKKYDKIISSFESVRELYVFYILIIIKYLNKN